jgi:transcriptional regulator with XRE-family HTH domain
MKGQMWLKRQLNNFRETCLKNLEELGQRVRIARVRRRLSTEDLAQACGIGRRTLYRIESGEPGIAMGTFLSVLWKLALLDTVPKDLSKTIHA